MLRYVVVDDLRVFKEHTHNRLAFQSQLDHQDKTEVHTSYFRDTDMATLMLEANLAVGNEIDNLFLDHDLGDGGGDMVQWVNFELRSLLERYPDQIKCITIISMNPVGAKRLFDDCANLPGNFTIVYAPPTSLGLTSAEIED